VGVEHHGLSKVGENPPFHGTMVGTERRLCQGCTGILLSVASDEYRTLFAEVSLSDMEGKAPLVDLVDSGWDMLPLQSGC